MASKFKNIESIISKLKPKCNKVIKLDKLDGITIECYVNSSEKSAEGIEEISNICKELKLSPISIEENKEKQNVFVLQFPELEPEYTEAQIKKMYESSFKWLLDDLYAYDANHKVTFDLLIEYRDMFVKQSIMMYFKSNTNQYKDTLENYLSNTEYRSNINKLYLTYLQEYINNKEGVN